MGDVVTFADDHPKFWEESFPDWRAMTIDNVRKEETGWVYHASKLWISECNCKLVNPVCGPW